jgi:membrane peptidoglycan carboxypeptidase
LRENANNNPVESMTNPPVPPDDYDDDIPFRLPKAEGYERSDLSDSELRAQDAPIPAEPTIDLPPAKPIQDSTDELSADAIEAAQRRAAARPGSSDIPFNLPQAEERQPKPFRPRHQPDAPTLGGTGGLDPSPDVTVRRQAEPGAQNTLYSASRNEQTVESRYQRPTQQSAAPDNRYPYVPAPPTLSNPMPQIGAMSAQGMRPLPRKRKRGFRPGCLAIALGLMITFCGGFTLLSLVVGGIAYARVGDLVNERLQSIETYNPFQTTFLLDRNGEELYQVIGEGRRTRIALGEIPRDVVNATIATEDDEFFTNIGIDIPATVLAISRFAGGNSSTAGGSTITQQLVRNVLFPFEYRNERSAGRKAEEIILAIALTGRLSKDEILELYLNEIYYGNLAYGIEAASQTFFGKRARDLTLAESALLAGLPQAPVDLNPLNPDPVVQNRLAERWRLVLDLMVEEKYITQEQHDQALRDGYTLVPPDVPLNAPHFTVYARDEFLDLMQSLGYSPDQVASGGYRVYTTVDIRLNEQAQSAVRDQLARLTSNNVTNGAVVILKPITGEILAMVGSADYENEAIDGSFNVTIGLRQPGSTVKAFTYAAAIERGMSSGEVIWDTRTEIGIPGQVPYIPVNYDNTFHGPMRPRYALANSYNIPAVQTLRHAVGVEYLVNFMRRLGLTSVSGDPSLYGLSLTLGGAELSPLELTRGFGVFANQGYLVDTQAILCVVDFQNNIIYQYENSCPEGQPTATTINRGRAAQLALDPRIAFIISDILSDNQARTPAMGAQSDLVTQFTSSVKTGTTNDNKDNWTVGFTRNVVVGVWVGNSNGSQMVGTSGLTGAAPIWNRVISGIYGAPDILSEFQYQGQLFPDTQTPSQGMSRRTICDVRALQDPANGCAGQVSEWFLDGPAGVPDGGGGLAFPQQNAPSNDPNSSVQSVSPGVYKAWVVRLPPEVSNSIQFSVGPGQKRPPAPIYCRVPPALLGSATNATEQFFIAPPPDANDAAVAEEYARARNLAFLPTIECSAEMLNAGGGQNFGGLPVGIIASNITSPAAGEVVSGGPRPIIGTVDFSQGQVQAYRILIRGPKFPDWVTLGEPHFSSVYDGQLEVLYPPDVPGSYMLQLELIGFDGSLVQVPVQIPFNVP